MYRPLVRRKLRLAGRLVVTVAVLCGLLAGTVGFPIAPPMSIGGAYPCQGNGCGCKSAEDCWFGCCCTTPAQRLAWAKRNHVKPPQGLVNLVQISRESGLDRGSAVSASNCARASSASTTRRKPFSGSPGAKAVASCCAKHRQPACCDQSAGGLTTCCSSTSEEKSLARETETEDESPAITTGRCRGPGQWWIVSGQPLGMPERPVALPLPTSVEPVLLSFAGYSADRDSPPTRPG